MIPDHFFGIPYLGANYPGAKFEGDPPKGMNCQVFAYTILKHFGWSIPDFRSSDLWEDKTYTKVVTDFETLDLLLWNRTNKAWGAHVGLYLGEGKAIHLSKEHGWARIEDLDTLKSYERYQVFVGAKRLL